MRKYTSNGPISKLHSMRLNSLTSAQMQIPKTGIFPTRRLRSSMRPSFTCQHRATRLCREPLRVQYIKYSLRVRRSTHARSPCSTRLRPRHMTSSPQEVTQHRQPTRKLRSLPSHPSPPTMTLGRFHFRPSHLCHLHKFSLSQHNPYNQYMHYSHHSHYKQSNKRSHNQTPTRESAMPEK
jgi:hypothetical protein